MAIDLEVRVYHTVLTEFAFDGFDLLDLMEYEVEDLWTPAWPFVPQTRSKS